MATKKKTYTEVVKMSPDEWVEDINTLLHNEPYSYIFHAFFWSTIFIVLCPIVGTVLLCRAIFKGCRYFLIKPMTNEQNSVISKTKDVKGENTKLLAVYITGCDTGFGRDLTFALAEKGFFVFAGCITDTGIKQYEGFSKIVPIKVDVTKDNEVKEAADIVKEWLGNSSATLPRYLHAVINNAGIAIAGLFDWTDISVHQKAMDVNYFGTFRTIKSFLPTLKKQATDGTHPDARIINVLSMAGLATNIGMSSYYGSKHAQEALSSCLRLELKAFNIDVVSVNPAVHKTNMNSEVREITSMACDNLNPDMKEEYGQDYFSSYITMMCKNNMEKAWRAENVRNQLVYCVDTFDPPPQVLIGSNAKYLTMLYRMLPVAVQVKMAHRVNSIEKVAAMKKS